VRSKEGEKKIGQREYSRKKKQMKQMGRNGEGDEE
jgi:hypothetical protein